MQQVHVLKKVQLCWDKKDSFLQATQHRITRQLGKFTAPKHNSIHAHKLESLKYRCGAIIYVQFALSRNVHSIFCLCVVQKDYFIGLKEGGAFN